MQATTQMTFADNKSPIKTQSIIFPKQRNFPFFTILLGVLVSTVIFSPQMTFWLQFDRSAILHGQIWRLFTCHLTHWSVSHLFWDMLMFLVLAGIIEWFSRRQFLTCFVAGCFIVSLIVITILPGMTYYRGLSGIDSGLFMLLLVLLYRRNAAAHNLLHKIPYIMLGLLFVGKLAFELSTAQSVFVQSSDLFVPVPLAHLGGAFVGWTIGTLPSRKHL